MNEVRHGLMLEALGNLGDFVGGLAVVATLIYLAVQVRQNTEPLRRSAELEYVSASESTFESFSRFRAQIVSNPGLAELYYKGTIDPRSLDPVRNPLRRLRSWRRRRAIGYDGRLR